LQTTVDSSFESDVKAGRSLGELKKIAEREQVKAVGG
jgi:hypothetical protein